MVEMAAMVAPTSSMRNKLFFLLIAILGLVGCNQKTVYHHYEHASESGWEKNDTLKFFVSPIQAAGHYHENVEMRVVNNFPFLGLTLIVEQTVFPLGETQRHTLECCLMNEEGHPKGPGISFYQYSFPLMDLDLNKGDSIQINIIHNMKREIIPGIADIGVKIQR